MHNYIMNINNILAKVLYANISEKNLFAIISDYVGYNNILNNCGLKTGKYLYKKDGKSIIRYINEDYFEQRFISGRCAVYHIQTNAQIIKKLELYGESRIIYADDKGVLYSQFDGLDDYILVKEDYTNKTHYIIDADMSHNVEQAFVFYKINKMFLITYKSVDLYDYMSGQAIKRIKRYQSTYFHDVNTNSLICYYNNCFYKIDSNLDEHKIINYIDTHSLVFEHIEYIDSEYIIIMDYINNVGIINLLDTTKNNYYCLDTEFNEYKKFKSCILGKYIAYIYAGGLIIYDLITRKKMYRIKDFGAKTKEDNILISPMGKNIFRANKYGMELIC